MYAVEIACFSNICFPILPAMNPIVPNIKYGKEGDFSATIIMAIAAKPPNLETPLHSPIPIPLKMLSYHGLLIDR